MSDKFFIVLDIETSHLKPEIGDIIEVAAIKVDAETSEIVDRYESLIKAKLIDPDFTTKLTGITQEMLDTNGRDVKEVLKEFSEFCGGYTCYAHYYPFDQGYLRYHMDRNGVAYTAGKWKDSMDVFSMYLDRLANRKLETYIRHYGLATSEDHRAMSDLMHTFTLLKMANEKAKKTKHIRGSLAC